VTQIRFLSRARACFKLSVEIAPPASRRQRGAAKGSALANGDSVRSIQPRFSTFNDVDRRRLTVCPRSIDGNPALILTRHVRVAAAI